MRELAVSTGEKGRITDNTGHSRLSRLGTSCLAVTVNYFCDFACDLIFLFIFRLRTIADELLLLCYIVDYCRFINKYEMLF